MIPTFKIGIGILKRRSQGTDDAPALYHSNPQDS